MDGEKSNRMERNCSKDALVDRVEDGSMMSERFCEKIKIQNWRKMTMERDAWNRMAEQTKNHKE